jgi:hypothetical protein
MQQGEGMASDYGGLTVAELKDLLRERGLPVSGAKGLLVARLEEFDARSTFTPEKEQPSEEPTTGESIQVTEGKIQFPCRVCRSLLAVPAGYNGKVECPSCKAKQPVGKLSGLKDEFPFDLTRNQWSMGVSIAGVIIGLLAIFVFFSAFSFEVMCPEENRGEVVQDGEVYQTCTGGSWGPTLTRMFISCCMLVPIATFLTQMGLSLRKPPVKYVQPSSLQQAAASPSGQHQPTEDRFTDSAGAETLQSVAKWFGLGLSTAAGILALVGIAIVVFFVYLVLTWQPY